MAANTKSKKRIAGNNYVPLDGGYGWVIVFGGALTHFMLVGMARCLGIIYQALRTKFNTSAQQTAWASAIFNTTRTLIAPVCGKLCARFGCRAIAIAGSFVLFVGLVISAFATSLYYVYFSFGILTGIGGAMVFTPVYVIVGQYFDKKKGKAMGFATLGSGLGNVVLAPLLTIFVQFYGFFGAMLILGALQLHNLISALLYTPLAKLSKLKPEHREEEEVMKSVVENESEDQISLVNGKSSINQDAGDIAVATNHSKADNDKAADMQIDVSLDENTDNKAPAPKCNAKNSLGCNFTFLVYGLLIMCLQANIQTFLIFLPDFAREKGASDTAAGMVLSVMGFADMGGRFLCGFIFDIKPLRQNRRFLYCISTFLFGGATICMSVMPSYLALVIMTAIVGIVEGGAHSQRMTGVSEFVPPSQMASAVGFVIFFQGVGNIWGPPIAGALRDRYDTNAYCYVFVGVALMVASVLFLIQITVCQKLCQNRSPEKKDQPIENQPA